MFSGFRGRFGRRRRSPNRPASIDETWLRKLSAALPVESLARAACDAVPDTFALIATARDASGGAWLLAVSPRSGLDAALAVAVAAARGIGEPNAQCVAASPEWGGATRRLAAQVNASGRAIRLLEIAGDGEDSGEDDAPQFVPAERLGAGLASAEARALFARGAEGLRGLAAKHGGALRSAGGELELVIAASALAALRIEDGEPTLEIRYPSRSAHPLRGGQLADALDRLEGQVRKRLGERDARDGEEGLRSRLARPFAASAAPRFSVLWPFGGAAEAADGVGVAEDGSLVVFAVRERVGLAELSSVIRASAALEPVLPYLTQEAAPPVRVLDGARVLIAGLNVLPGVEQAAAALAEAPTLFRAAAIEGPFHALAAAPAAAPAPRPVTSAAPAFTPAPAALPAAAAPSAPMLPAPAPGLAGERERHEEARGEGGDGARRRRRRGRRRGRSGRPFDDARPGEEPGGFAPGAEGEELGDESGEGEAAGFGPEEIGAPAASAPAAAPAGAMGFETMSLLDFEDDAPTDSQGPAIDDGARRGGPRGRRRRGRGRRGGAGGERSEGGEEEEEPAAASPGLAAPALAADDEDDHDVPELAEAPEIAEVEVPRYEDDEEEPESELDRVRLERERRRRERAQSGDAATPPAEAGPAESAERGLPRGRVAIVAHADRESIAAAVLLARELRQLEGIWIYPQDELMTFFRGVATDLREGTPIYLLGFAPRPARDLLQAAAVYQGRLVWFDHHEWPPEDLGAMKSTLGEPYTLVRPGGDSVLPLVLPHCGRRSRFSDKLIDLVTGRFTPHDFQRWGGLWWWRLGQLTHKPGERRAELDLLIAGRPSDLTREAERCDVPAPPPEVAWVASRDFRIVHFAGIAMVVVEVPASLDLHMALRVARERFGAMIALGRREGEASFVLAAEDSASRRPIDVAGMVEHLAQKFSWVEALPDDDHVARFRVKGLAGDPSRAETLVAEIGMGRSILEG
jgi:hypothetical protein